MIPCASDELYRASIILHPELFAEEEKANAAIREQTNALVFRKAGTIHYVPVVFHIIHGGGTENISQAQILDQIRILNEDFRKMQGTNGWSGHALAADMEIEFRLAQYEPSGKKHDGINRIYNTVFDTGATDNTKALITWDSKRYLNVWVVSTINSASAGSTGVVLGYAQFPWQLSAQGATDGIVIRADQVGMIGSADQSQAGRTLTHEIGHWLGLYHTFQGGCVGNTSATCNSKGDQVCDTPPVTSASFGCQTGKNSCTNDVPDSLDFIHNYMDYSDGTCMNMYTNGQKARVGGAMGYRTGIFGTSPAFVQNLTYAGIGTDGSYLPVAPSPTKLPYFYSFEVADVVNSGYVINNFNNPLNGWQINTSVAHTGNKSMYMRNFMNGTTRINSRDGFQTPEIDLSQASNPVLEFYYAYAQKSTASNDSLTVRISDDFGMHEVPVWRESGSTMTTAGIQTGEYIPQQQEWRKVAVSLAAFKSYTHARFRFEFLNRRGNNVYVDDIALTDGFLGLDDLRSDMRFSAFPNPMTDHTTLAFELKTETPITITVYDATGRTQYLVDNVTLQAGAHQIEIPRGVLKSGFHFLKIEAGERAFTHKLLVN